MYKISLQQIEYFLTTAETKSFTDAANLLYISQPALSKQINAIESELGLKLFSRTNQGIQLTPEGASLYNDWSSLNEHLDNSIYKARIIGNNASGQISIGCVDSFGINGPISDAINQFRMEYPEVSISILGLTFKQIREGLLEDKFDIVFIPYFVLNELPDVNWIKLYDFSLCIAVSKSSPLALKDELTIADLKDETFILISPVESSEGTEHTKRLCRMYGYSPKNIVFVPNIASMVLSIESGLGVGISRRSMFANDLDSCRCYDLGIDLNDTFVIAAWRKKKKNYSLDLFIEKLLNEYPGRINY